MLDPPPLFINFQNNELVPYLAFLLGLYGGLNYHNIIFHFHLALLLALLYLI